MPGGRAMNDEGTWKSPPCLKESGVSGSPWNATALVWL
jgi:hypothetical protein